MFKGRLGVWILALLIAIGGPWLYKQIPVWLHTDDVVVASELTNIDMLEAMSQEKFGHFKVQTTTQTPDVIFSTDNTVRSGYECIENAVTSPLVLYVINVVDNYESGFIQDDNNQYYFRINLRTILNAIEDDATWQDIGISKKVLEGKVTLHIPDANDWCYPEVVELFYLTLNGGVTPTTEQRTEMKDRVDSILSQCRKYPSIAQAIADEAAKPSDGNKAFIAPEYLYLTNQGMSANSSHYFVPVYFTKTVYIAANAYLKAGYNDIDLSHGLFQAIQSNKSFMNITGWRPKDAQFNITKAWNRMPNVV